MGGKKEITVDVRSREEFRKRKGNQFTLNIPLNELENNIDFLKQFEKIYLVCLTGIRAEKAQDILEDNDIWTSEVFINHK